MNTTTIETKANWNVEKVESVCNDRNHTTLMISKGKETLYIMLDEDGSAWVDVNTHRAESKEHPTVTKETRNLKTRSRKPFTVKKQTAQYGKIKVSLRSFPNK